MQTPEIGGISEFSGSSSVVTKNDRILLETRVLAAFIVPFLLVAFVMLYIFPNDTDTLFAWTIKPPMTPFIMGAGYISGSYFFSRVFFAKRWHTIHLGFLPITAFTLFMAIASFLHLDRFHHGHIAFYAWMGLYIVTPFLVPLVWWRNSRTDSRKLEAGDLMLPKTIRYILGLAGLIQFAIALVLLISPDFMISVWPWKLTPLTAQVIGGWFALPSVVAMLMALDGRWSAIRITLHSQIIGLGLMLVGVVRGWGDFDQSNTMTWAFVGGISLMFLALIALDFYMQNLKRQATANPSSGGKR